MGRGLVAIVLGASVLITFSTASAFDVRTGDNLVVSGGEVVYEDLFIAGDTITIDGSIEGEEWLERQSFESSYMILLAAR